MYLSYLCPFFFLPPWLLKSSLLVLWISIVMSTRCLLAGQAKIRPRLLKYTNQNSIRVGWWKLKPNPTLFPVFIPFVRAFWCFICDRNNSNECKQSKQKWTAFSWSGIVVQPKPVFIYLNKKMINWNKTNLETEVKSIKKWSSIQISVESLVALPRRSSGVPVWSSSLSRVSRFLLLFTWVSSRFSSFSHLPKKMYWLCWIDSSCERMEPMDQNDFLPHTLWSTTILTKKKTFTWRWASE